MQTWLVTGGAGFIGSNFVLHAREKRLARIVNLDKLTYAGCAANLVGLEGDPEHLFVRGDIGDAGLLRQIFREQRPTRVFHFAAESHVDRSIEAPESFIQTNVVGSFQLLEQARIHWQSLPANEAALFRFLHVSTDEVYGSLAGAEAPFSETRAFTPNSPYAASKAASDHLARAYFHTYGLPTLTSHCSNNYGPYQFPEKLLPLIITKALAEQPLPIYGDGKNVRDWLYVGDHVAGLLALAERGRPGETYNIGGHCERDNLSLVQTVCQKLDRVRPRAIGRRYEELISFVADRPGHDRRYAIDSRKIEAETGWRAQESLESGLDKTLAWYLANEDWCKSIRNGRYRGERLGLIDGKDASKSC